MQGRVIKFGRRKEIKCVGEGKKVRQEKGDKERRGG